MSYNFYSVYFGKNELEKCTHTESVFLNASAAIDLLRQSFLNLFPIDKDMLDNITEIQNKLEDIGVYLTNQRSLRLMQIKAQYDDIEKRTCENCMKHVFATKKEKYSTQCPICAVTCDACHYYVFKSPEEKADETNVCPRCIELEERKQREIKSTRETEERLKKQVKKGKQEEKGEEKVTEISVNVELEGKKNV